MHIQELQQKIAQLLPCEHLSVTGDGRHFFVEVVSTAFNGKTRLARHRLIKDGLKSLMASDELHALSITVAQTPDEWANNQQQTQPAFRCHHGHLHK
ncbi:MAG: BolA/IbaG family iron-sulfur metabolism protein [Neisseriaceae bacterium]|nr:BolA/IbaG family iron-sulfur metabolism protein [Neisseriaceae bacterium]